jgi:hypothetical protein
VRICCNYVYAARRVVNLGVAGGTIRAQLVHVLVRNNLVPMDFSEFWDDYHGRNGGCCYDGCDCRKDQPPRLRSHLFEQLSLGIGVTKLEFQLLDSLGTGPANRPVGTRVWLHLDESNVFNALLDNCRLFFYPSWFFKPYLAPALLNSWMPNAFVWKIVEDFLQADKKNDPMEF